MSKIALEPNASGTGTFTIASPNSNTSRTLTLPDADGALLNDASSLDASNLTGTLPALDGSNLTGIDSSPPTTAGAVGTYAFAYYSVGSLLTFGGTYSGSSLYPCSIVSTGNAPLTLENTSYLSTGSSTLSGTWRSMGEQYGNASFKHVTVYVRIA